MNLHYFVLDTFQCKYVSSFARKFKLEGGGGRGSVVFLPRFAALQIRLRITRGNVIRRRVSLLGRLLEIHGNANSDPKLERALFLSRRLSAFLPILPGGSHQQTDLYRRKSINDCVNVSVCICACVCTYVYMHAHDSTRTWRVYVQL